jgi:ABC-2 type transport system permease protein
MARILFVMPILQLLVLSYAANFEIKNIKLFIIDKDQSSTSRNLIAKVQSSRYFTIQDRSLSIQAGFNTLENDKVDAFLTIPPGFERSVYRGEDVQIQFMLNAINGTKAALSEAYMSSIIQQYSLELLSNNQSMLSNASNIDISYRYWYNTKMDYKIYMSPGILVMIATMVSLFLTSINIVREKEIGTFEQLNVTSVGRTHFIIGKLVPFWIIGLINFFVGLLLIHLIFDVPVEGNLLIIFLFVNLYLLALLGMGMFISTVTHTQQQAMFISWFFMVIFILLSGLFTPIEFMPEWAKLITWLNPVAYFVKFVRMVVLKGSNILQVAHLLGSITIFAVVINILAVWNYRKTVS